MGSQFKSQLAKMQKSFTEGKKKAKEFGTDIPNGIYEGQLQTYKMEISRGEAKRLQVCREVLIDDGGSQDGNVSRDWQGIEHPVGMSFLMQNIAMHGYEMPDDTSGIEDCVEAIDGDAPRYRFQISEKGGYKNFRILEILESGEEADGGEAGEPEGEEPEADGEADGEGEEMTEEEAQIANVQEFCDGQGVEYDADDDLDVLKEKISEYEFYLDSLTQEDIDELGFDESSPEEGISEDDKALLEDLDLGELVKAPVAKKKTVAKKGAARKRK